MSVVTLYQTNLVEATTESKFFFVKSGKSFHRMLWKDILYFEGEKEYVKLVTPTLSLLIYRRLKDVEGQLPASYCRMHNSFIVNLAQIERVQDNHVYIGGRQITISDKFKEQFMTRIHQHLL